MWEGIPRRPHPLRRRGGRIGEGLWEGMTRKGGGSERYIKRISKTKVKKEK